MITITGLRCRECGNECEVAATHVCDFCFGPLEPIYDTAKIAAAVSRESIESGPQTLWRYADLLPVLSDDPDLRVDMGTGLSPLTPAPRLAEALGVGELWLKNDTRNPTGSFKDRVVTVALSAAKALGIETVACASTGNLANSVAGHAAHAGLESYVFIPHDLERGKVVNSAVYGTNLVSVKGNYDDVNRLCAEVAETKGWGFVNVNLRAFYAEGSKTIGFEIAEQLGWELPDHVVAPVASGSMMSKIGKAFDELRQYGLVSEDETCRVSGAQADGCSPVATAFREGTLDIRPVKPDTIARSLAIGNPADGYYALKLANQSGGVVESVNDDEVVAGIRLLAETTGVFAETAGGVTIGNLKKLVRDGVVGRDDRVVAVISGIGLKTIEAVEPHVGPTYEVSPALEDFESRLAEAAA